MFLLASAVATLHGLLVCCVVAGSVAAIAGALRQYRRIETAFYCLIAFVIASDLFLGECVLTRWEQALRNATDPGSAYRGSFIGHYCFFLPPFVHAYVGSALVIASLLALPYWRVRDRWLTHEETGEAERP